jgi:hypothetical protein
MNKSLAIASPPSAGRLWFWLGVGLPVLAVVAYAVQVGRAHLRTPWYLPSLATLGVVLLAVALWKRRTVWRVLALVAVVLCAGAAWAFLLMTRLPAYEGPVAASKPFPAFATARADGTPFTERDLQGGPNHVLVFFRGRW